MTEEKRATIAQMFGPLRVKWNEPMKRHTNNKIGGSADLYIETTTREELKRLVRLCRECNFPFVVLGGATNVLISDRGVRGLVIKHRAEGMTILGVKGSMKAGKRAIGAVLVEVESGTPIGHLVSWTIDRSLAGMESFMGLPGTVGGAVYDNSHFQRHGEFFGDHVVSGRVLNRVGKEMILSHDAFAFDYDASRLQQSGEILLSVTLRLHPGQKDQLKSKATEASQTIRLKEQPYQIPSHGCSFQNLTSNQALAAQIPGGNLSVGALVEQCGLKGTRCGDAEISPQHSNFIVNHGNATAKDVLCLMEKMRTSIREKFGIEVKPEIFLIGEFSDRERASVGAPGKGRDGNLRH